MIKPASTPQPGAAPPAPTPASERRRAGRFFASLWGVLNAYLVGAFIAVIAVFVNDGKGLSASGVLAGLLAFFLLVALHEAGHYLAARMAGDRLLMMEVWPLLLRATQRGPRLSLSPTGRLFGGFVLTVPRAMAPAQRRLLAFYAGGVAANIAFGLAMLAAFAALALYSGRDAADMALPGLTLIATGMMSLWMGIANLIPLRIGDIPTDGARVLALLRRSPEVRDWEGTQRLYSQAVDGVRPRDWDPDLVREVVYPEGRDPEPGTRLMGYYHALDQGRIEQAGDLMDASLAEIVMIPRFARPGVLLEAAYFEARHRAGSVKARDLLGQAKGGLVNRYDRLRAEAAVRLAEGDSAGARSAAEGALAASWESSARGFQIAEEEWIRDLMNEAARGAPATPTGLTPSKR